jgi:glutamate--cysteine ligase
MTMATTATTATTAQSEPLTLESASRYIYDAALADSEIGAVGLEVETHLVDMAAVRERVAWTRLRPAIEDGAAELRRSVVTVEPGGQVELSGFPESRVEVAVAAMRHDEQRLRLVLAERGLGLAHLGADPLRTPRRVNPRPRYRAMERHFVATGRADAGLTMMCATAALQVNLQAGPRSAWAERVALAQQLGPTLTAITACSRWLNGHDTGWASARQRAWLELDPRTSGAVTLSSDPAADWVRHALAAPVLFATTDADDAVAIARAIPFSAWLSGRIRLADRLPTLEDLRAHLTTLFPPVRMRGYLELRYLYVSAPRWWPAVAAVTATLMDDPIAAAAAAEATEPTTGRWEAAARDGLRDSGLAASARRCMAIAVDRAPAELRTAVADLAELVDSGRSPGDLAAERIAEVGVRVFLEEVAHA